MTTTKKKKVVRKKLAKKPAATKKKAAKTATAKKTTAARKKTTRKAAIAKNATAKTKTKTSRRKRVTSESASPKAVQIAVMPTRMTVENIAEVHARLTAPATPTAGIDAANVEIVDACAIQLIAAYTRHQPTTPWHGIADVLRESAERLGLADTFAACAPNDAEPAEAAADLCPVF